MSMGQKALTGTGANECVGAGAQPARCGARLPATGEPAQGGRSFGGGRRDGTGPWNNGRATAGRKRGDGAGSRGGISGMVRDATDGGRGAVREQQGERALGERVGARWRVEHGRPVRSRKRGRRTGLTTGRGRAAGSGSRVRG